jgi:hypothetical protein
VVKAIVSMSATRDGQRARAALAQCLCLALPLLVGAVFGGGFAADAHAAPVGGAAWGGDGPFVAAPQPTEADRDVDAERVRSTLGVPSTGTDGQAVTPAERAEPMAPRPGSL